MVNPKMRILFKHKSNNAFEFICLSATRGISFRDLNDIDPSNIPDIDGAEVLYHYRDSDGYAYPVYYEYHGEILTSIPVGYLIKDTKSLTKDYTLVNLNLLDDGDTT